MDAIYHLLMTPIDLLVSGTDLMISGLGWCMNFVADTTKDLYEAIIWMPFIKTN